MALSAALATFTIAAVSAEVVASDGSDAAALMQHKAESSFNYGYNYQLQDACNCRSWKEVYSSKSANCELNTGNEFGFLSTAQRRTLMRSLTKTYCTHFHELIPGNFCLSKKFNSLTENQWCYVSPECKKLNGGAKVNSKVAWKNCKSASTNGTDILSNEWTPEEMLQVTYSQGIPLDMLAKYAYPVYTQKWEDVAYFFLPKGAATPRRSPIRMLFSMARKSKEKLQAIRDSGKPMLFDSTSGMPPYHIVTGSKVFEVVYTQWKMDNEEHRGEGDGPILWEHPGWLTTLSCIEGCSPSPQ